MAEEGKGIALAILGIVAVIAVVGLVLLFQGAKTAKIADASLAKVYSEGWTEEYDGRGMAQLRGCPSGYGTVDVEQADANCLPHPTESWKMCCPPRFQAR